MRNDRWLDQEIESLVATAVSGVGTGFTDLYRLLAGRVAGYVRSLGVHDVDDVVNEVFLGAFRNIDTFVGDGAIFRTWLFTIAHHKAVDSLRASSRRDRRDAMVSSALPSMSVGDVEREALAGCESADIDLMLSVLTPEQREVVMLRVIADLSLEQVATALAKPIGAIKSIQHRAISSLQRAAARPAMARGEESASSSRGLA